jgi:putative Holliday junction resolvase
MQRMPIILGLDIGDARIGVAISDELGFAAHPLCTVTRKNRKTDLQALRTLIDTHEVERVVMGLPLMPSGDIGVQAQKVERFANALKRVVDIPIDFWDERLTTVEAGEILSAMNKRGKKRKKVIDQVAAVLILNEYLNAHRSCEDASDY